MFLSPSVRKVWIEICIAAEDSLNAGSPSVRKVWIEMYLKKNAAAPDPSPSVRKVWIEMFNTSRSYGRFIGHLL